MTLTYYLIFRADRTARVTTRRPRTLRIDEVAVPLKVNFAEGWGKLLAEQEFTLHAPDAPSIEVESE